MFKKVHVYNHVSTVDGTTVMISKSVHVYNHVSTADVEVLELCISAPHTTSRGSLSALSAPYPLSASLCLLPAVCRPRSALCCPLSALLLSARSHECLLLMRGQRLAVLCRFVRSLPFCLGLAVAPTPWCLCPPLSPEKLRKVFAGQFIVYL
jgi:hypothetical protein